MAHTPWPASEPELAQMRAFNKKLAWLPRFKIRNRVTPRVIQALLRVSQTLKKAPVAETRRVGAVPVRILRPEGQPTGVVLDIHGGGWVIGNAQMDDDLNLGMVRACDVAVVSVDYRLALDTPIEGLMEDCLAAARWLLSADEFAGLPVIVVGESAGGHLAAATLLALKQWPDLLKRVSGAVLYYGVYDLTGTPSVRAAGPDTLLLDGPGMVEALRMLTPGLSDEARRQPPLSPLYGDFSGLPPALMFVGALDPLKDDTLQIAERWGAVAEVQAHLLPESAHGFIHFPVAMAQAVLRHSRAWITARIKASSTTVDALAGSHPQLLLSHHTDATMREYTLTYLFNNEPRTHVFELKQPELPLHEAAMHVLQLHFGDAENGLILPAADATPEEILEQAEVVGITQIKVL